jgi:ABC-type polysaccharide/polyol phosphate export permease
VLGQLWRVLNPLLLALVYFLVLGVIFGARRGDPDYLARLLSGLFAFYYTSNAINIGARSIVGGGQLILNTAFPRALLPVSAVISAFLIYLPMLAVYAVFHLVRGLPVGWPLLAMPLIVAIHTVFNLGVALILAALTVYFRDMSSFLPFLLRIWLYLSPILWVVEDVPARLRAVLALNPLSPIFTSWHTILIDGTAPDPLLLAQALAWAAAAIIGGTWFFLSREREFAIRI